MDGNHGCREPVVADGQRPVSVEEVSVWIYQFNECSAP
jgi:hypothetical protein